MDAEIDPEALAALNDSMGMSLDLSMQFHDDADSAQLTERLLAAAAPAAAQAVIHLATNAGNERVRLSAATWIIDHVREVGTGGGPILNPWDDVYEAILMDAEKTNG